MTPNIRRHFVCHLDTEGKICYHESTSREGINTFSDYISLYDF